MTRLRTELGVLSMTAERETERPFDGEVRVSALTCAQRRIFGGNVEIFVGQINSRLKWNCYSALQTSYMYLYENSCSLEPGVANIRSMRAFDTN